MTLIAQLKTIPDPRGTRGRRHPLWLILFLSLLGSLCGYWGYRPLAMFCEQHHASLCKLLDLEPKATLLPSYSTFRRVFQQVDAQAWVDAFNRWAILHAPERVDGLWSIDGKSIKCTSTGGNSSQQNFASLVSVYGAQAGVVQLELMYNAKLSEIEVAKRLLQKVTTTPALTQSLPIAFSLDALHAQVETLTVLESNHCHYLVGLKSNQKKLYQQLQSLAEQAVPISQATHSERLHGRYTQRSVQVYAAPDGLACRWADAAIRRVIWVERRGERGGKPFCEQHCYLSNALLDAQTALAMSRAHWQIENGLHWVKDVTLQEDYPPRRGGFAPISWAVFNSFLITLARRLGARTVPDCRRELANQVHQVFRWLT